MLYALLVVGLLLAAFLMTRLRFRLLLSPERKLLFFGLGRTGPEFDFVNRVIRIKLCGLKIKETAMRKPVTEAAERSIKSSPELIQPVNLKTGKEPPAPKEKRRRSLRLLLSIIATSTRVLWQYLVALIKGVIIEEAEGELALGFESPDVTGRVYGYYMALAGMIPSLANRFVLNPVFSGKSASGRAQLSIALPMYVIVYRTIILIARLPIRKIIKYSRGEMKGESHGE